jgi:hypothetical protein
MSAFTHWICCGVLQEELGELFRRGQIAGEVTYLDSILHLLPGKLEQTLQNRIECSAGQSAKVILVYGDCCPHMFEMARQRGVQRVDAINCAQLLVGRPRYRELMADGAFLMLPEWAGRWKEIFRDELDLSREVALDLMSENRGELVYLDTGLVPVPRLTLDECSEYMGLRLRIEPTPLDALLASLLKAESDAVPLKMAPETSERSLKPP